VERGGAGNVFVDTAAFDAAAATLEESSKEFGVAIVAYLREAAGTELKKQDKGPHTGLYDMDEVIVPNTTNVWFHAVASQDIRNGLRDLLRIGGQQSDAQPSTPAPSLARRC
jgi:hypothetical protein